MDTLKPVVGSFVTFLIAGPNGPHKVAGRVVRIIVHPVLLDTYEVKTQNNGYHTIFLYEVLSVR